MKLVVCLTLRGILLRVECLKALFHAGVVNAQKFVLRGSHVDEERLIVLCSVPLSNTLYRKTGNFAASVFIPICAGAAPAW